MKKDSTKKIEKKIDFAPELYFFVIFILLAEIQLREYKRKKLELLNN